ncbi:MAG TPA: FAD-binding oxidoreductase [Verrucomicrobiae bacterium]|jgi:hypothetical protein|nr:FAD-binding oxidoreductase [Verrucomicrobiae bacterium]
MILAPQSREDLVLQLRHSSEAAAKVESVRLSSLNALIEHKPEDMTATTEAGMTLAAFQAQLGKSGQWLPIDPPNSDSLTISDLLAHNLSGPRRFGYGSIRDYLIGIQVAMADGQLIKAGGKVVKNVAGYDLCKLFIGARHSLGIIVEATFKLRPLPEKEVIIEQPCGSLAELDSIARSIRESPVQPVISDSHNSNSRITLVLGFDGAREDVEYQIETIRPMGTWIPSSIAYENEFWRDPSAIQKLSVLPSETLASLQKLNGLPFVARLGNGVVYYKGPALEQTTLPNPGLHQRVKDAYDPKHIFPGNSA